MRLVDPETDEEVPVGAVGELVVRSKHPVDDAPGYYGMPDKTAEAWRNLWFHTGDALRRDEDGWYYFVDRYKDALRRRGENISSYEVEQAILAHPAVAECAVVGVPADVEAGEDEVMVVIVPVRAGRDRRRTSGTGAWPGCPASPCRATSGSPTSLPRDAVGEDPQERAARSGHGGRTRPGGGVPAAS